MAGAHGAAVLILLCVLVASQAPVAHAQAGDSVEGFTNPFGDEADGSLDLGGCAYGQLDPAEYPFYDVMLVAPGSALAAGNTLNGCGSCYEIQCADQGRCKGTKTVTAMVGGTCSEGCDDSSFNLHVNTFSQLSSPQDGGISVRIRKVSCAPGENILVTVNEYRATEGGYIKLAIRNVPGDGGLTALEIKGSNEAGGWRSADNTFGAAWEASLIPNPPLDIRITNTKGERLILRGIITTPGFLGDALSDVQFGKPSNASAAPSRPDASPAAPGASPSPAALPRPSPLPSLVASSPSPSPITPSPTSVPGTTSPTVGAVPSGSTSSAPTTAQAADGPPRRPTSPSPSPAKEMEEANSPLPPGPAASRLLDSP
eukprot:evm.model.scf_1759.4 EVM.evm.TU.scf_1759.4   scf_1759:20146-24117(+)